MPEPGIRFGFIRSIAAAAVAAASFAFGPAALAGAADNVTGWAWSGSIGWVSMNCTNQASCATADYGVTIVETPGFSDRGDLKGWAWSETVGWICFGLTCTGTTPEGGASYAQYRANHNGKQDQFFGWAKVESMGDDGWISLNCDKDVGADDCATSAYHVRLNNVTGAFTAGLATDHWGWGSVSTGVGVGWVDFSIVNTSWVLANLGTILRPQGVFEPEAVGLAGTRQFTFPITFVNFSGALNQRLECEVLLPDGSKRVIGKVLASVVRNGTTTLDYTIQSSDAIQQNRIWYLTSCRIAGSAFGAACASDATCAPTGICDEGAGFCRQLIAESNRRRPIYTHGNEWTGLGAAQDQYLAIKCNAGFPDNYFKNAAQCDFTGDASFALAMRRGIPVEGDCGDFVDNDGNGQTDCADRYCKGIAYRCQVLPKTSCAWGMPGDGMNDCSDGGYVNGDLCCTRQPRASNPGQYHVVDGLECSYGDPSDGYFDCDCTSGQFGRNADCYSPGYQAGDLCCDPSSQVIKP